MQGYDEDVQSWLSVSPSSGKASASPQVITIKAIENKGANRKADLVFYGNIMHQAPLTITQEGPEGEWASMTIAEFIEKADTENEYVLTGVVGDIATNEKYWGFSLKDETGTISCPFIGENAEEFKKMDIHTGDKISIRGVYEFYSSKSEHQLSDGVIVEHTPLSTEDIETVTVQNFIEAADPYTMYRLTGEVSSSVNAEYCSFDLTDETGTIVVWTVNNASEYASTLKKGDKVTLRGAYTWFEHETDESKSKHEVVDATIESVEAGQGGETGTPEGSGTAEDPYNVAAAYKYIDDGGFSGNDNVSPEVYVKGTITSIEEVDTGNFGNATYMISDGEGSVELEVFRGYYFNGDKFTSEDQIKVGDNVVVCGELTNHNGTYEFTSGSKIYSLNGQTGGGEEPDPSTEPTSAVKVNIEEFLDKPVNTTDWYELTGTIVNIESGNGEKYGNFTMSDESGSVYVYGLVSEWADGKNNQSFSEIGLEAGDIVTIWTLRAEHNGSAQAGGTIPAIYKGHEDGVPVTYPEGTVFLTFPDGNQKSVNGYTSTWQAVIGNYTFTLVNFNNNQNNWGYVKCGRKSDPSVGSISNDTAMPTLTSIEVTADKLNAAAVTSIELSIYSDQEQGTLVADGIQPKNGLAAGILTFEIPSAYQNANQYYKLTFDCEPAGDNGPVQISKVTYIAAE